MTISRSDDEPVIRIVAAVAVDGSGRVLLVRKRGTEWFMLPGGKLAPGEAAAEALARELGEELGCTLAAEPSLLGSFSAPAANEPGHRVEALIFTVELDGDPRACAEIEAFDWHDPGSDPAYKLAPLARDFFALRMAKPRSEDGGFDVDCQSGSARAKERPSDPDRPAA